MNQDKILITGANGFVGRALVYTLLRSNRSIRILTHSVNSAKKLRKEVPGDFDIYCLDDVSDFNQWDQLFSGVDTVVHCGAQLKSPDNSPESQEQLMQANFNTTFTLAKKAAKHKVRRFIFLSSMSVFGNMKQYTPFTENTSLEPIDTYGLSKLKAEEGLKTLSSQIELVIIRPPLVYGPGVKNNFKKLFTLVDKKLPLPLGAIRNKRHFIGINNLIHFIILCISSENAKNETFVIADNEALSTTELINRIGTAMRKKSYLIPVPHKALETVLKYSGLSRLSEQLFYNIVIDFSKAKQLLNWSPPFSFQEELQLSVDHFLIEKRKTTASIQLK